MPSGYGLFFREYVRHFTSTGSIAPSSRWLAGALARHVPKRSETDRPRRILEVGPGTGAVTSTLVRRLGPHDAFTLVELNEQFVAHLRQRFEREPNFATVSGQTTILNQRLEELPGEVTFDNIVSGLPLNNFSVTDVERILATYERLLAPGGTLSFFEYVAMRPVRAAVSGRATRDRLRGIGTELNKLFVRGRIGRETVWPNIPPAWVHHVCLPENGTRRDDR